MRIATVIVPVLLGLAAMPVLAQHGAPSDSGQNEMSYKDYLAQRARLLLRMKGESAQQQQPAPDAADTGRQEGRYGQGYASRRDEQARAARPPLEGRVRRGRSSAGRAAHPRIERPERPHFEHPEHPEHPERPERPERP